MSGGRNVAIVVVAAVLIIGGGIGFVKSTAVNVHDDVSFGGASEDAGVPSVDTGSSERAELLAGPCLVHVSDCLLSVYLCTLVSHRFPSVGVFVFHSSQQLLLVTTSKLYKRPRPRRCSS